MSNTEFPNPFERAFNASIPRDVARTFTEEQRAAIKTAFGGDRWHSHQVKIRGVVWLLRWYFVFAAGPDRRSKRRPRRDDSLQSSLVVRVALALPITVVTVLLAALLIYVMVY